MMQSLRNGAACIAAGKASQENAFHASDLPRGFESFVIRAAAAASLLADPRLRKVFEERIRKMHPDDVSARRFFSADLARAFTRQEFSAGKLPISSEMFTVAAGAAMGEDDRRQAAAERVTQEWPRLAAHLVEGRGAAVFGQVIRYDAVNRQCFASDEEFLPALRHEPLVVEPPAKVSVVLLNYNSHGHLGRALSALPDTLSAYPNVEILIVDNGSTCDSESVYSLFRWGSPRNTFSIPDSVPLYLLRSEINLGFDGGNNLAVEFATSARMGGRLRGTDAYWFLNNDTVADRSALSSLMEEMRLRPRGGAFGSVILKMDQNQTIESGPIRFGWHVPFGATVSREAPSGPCVTDRVAGASMLMRARAMEETGPFDASFFAYGEEQDLCLRLRNAGWQSWLVPQSRVEHYGNGSSSPNGPVDVPRYYSARNAIRTGLHLRDNSNLTRGDVTKHFLRAFVAASYRFVSKAGHPKQALRSLSSSIRGWIDGLTGRYFRHGNHQPLDTSPSNENIRIIRCRSDTT